MTKGGVFASDKMTRSEASTSTAPVFIAVLAIVTGHVIAIWLAHRVALREFGTARAAAIAGSPLTLLMILYTAISLIVIAEPMVTFDGT